MEPKRITPKIETTNTSSPNDQSTIKQPSMNKGAKTVPDDKVFEPEKMKKSSNGSRGKGLMTLTVILAIIAIAAGVFAYLQYSKDKKDKDSLTAAKASVEADLAKAKSDLDISQKDLADAKKQVTSTKQTDKGQIEAYLTAKCGADVKRTAAIGKITYDVVKTDFIQVSYLCKGDNEGPTAVFKKSNNLWIEIWSGIGPIDDSTRSMYKIPTDIPKYNTQ